MKKKFLMITGVVVTALLTATTLAATQPNPWQLVDESCYKMLDVDTDNPILIPVLQQQDYDEIQSELIDPQKAQEAYAINGNGIEINQDDFLKDNWESIQQALILERLEIRTLEESPRTKSLFPYKFEIDLDYSYGQEPINLQVIQTSDMEVTIPETPDDILAQFAITPDGTTSLLGTERGLWVINASNGNPNKISTEKTSEGKSYDELMELSIELYGDNIVQWNDQLSPSPNSQEVAYISNRDQIDSGGASLYVMDIATGQETMLTENNSYYSICGWLNDDYLVCDKYSSNTHKIVAISTNGLEITVPTSGSDPWVYAVHDGLIAYAPQLGSNQITILKFNEITGEVFETDTIIMGAETRLRAGNYGFSPDGQKFICLCVPEDNPENRFVGIYNIVDKNYDELYAPGTSDYIQSVDWIDDTSLLVVTGDSEDRLTTWTYELK